MTQADRLGSYYLDHPDVPIRRRVLDQVIGSGSVTQRNADLRKRGFVIEPSRRQIKGRMVTFFTYVSVGKRKKAA